MILFSTRNFTELMNSSSESNPSAHHPALFSFVKHHSVKSILKWTMVEIGIVVALLAIGGVMEISMI